MRKDTSKASRGSPLRGSWSWGPPTIAGPSTGRRTSGHEQAKRLETARYRCKLIESKESRIVSRTLSCCVNRRSTSSSIQLSSESIDSTPSSEDTTGISLRRKPHGNQPGIGFFRGNDVYFGFSVAKAVAPYFFWHDRRQQKRETRDPETDVQQYP